MPGTASLVRGSLSQYNGIKFVEAVHESFDGGGGAKTGRHPRSRSIRIGTGASPTASVRLPGLDLSRCSGALRAAFGIGSWARIVPRTR